MTVLQIPKTRKGNGWNLKELRSVHSTKVIPWFEATGRTLTVRTGTALFHDGEMPEGLFLVRSGSVEMTVSAHDGRKLKTGIARRGHVLGLESLFTNCPHPITAITVGPATVCFVPRADFFAFVEADPDVRMRLIHYLSEEVASSWGRIRTTLAWKHDRAHVGDLDHETPRIAAV